ncbi:carcinoembryonic antigen-related cell adhesion molecule 4-like isoform X2 [Vombatus ursinus]|uniref:carcinoembryonic antigen-related cell adhesion molecule 4-like isoform X2 n=1 Tax=Vombatus ursinus TaxID=29139 RepID=UPI000FFD6274|nr:carcinoembryonic antigen-related cell adhesion molecule 4-like isoform X2 [Vombatus ursinus]
MSSPTVSASIFSCWIQPTSAQGDAVSVVPSPTYGKVGSEVTLSIQGFSKTACRYTWYRKSTESSNQIISYHIKTSVQKPENSREMIFPNGSLLIPNLTLSDNDVYILQVVHSECEVTTVRTRLQVYADLHSTGIIKVSILVGAVTEVAILGAFIYILCIRKIGRDSRGILRNPILGRRIRQAQKEGDNSTLYMNNALLQGCPRLPQAQGSSSAASENIYQALHVTEADVYDKITPCKKPPALGKGKITKS